MRVGLSYDLLRLSLCSLICPIGHFSPFPRFDLWGSWWGCIEWRWWLVRRRCGGAASRDSVCVLCWFLFLVALSLSLSLSVCVSSLFVSSHPPCTHSWSLCPIGHFYSPSILTRGVVNIHAWRRLRSGLGSPLWPLAGGCRLSLFPRHLLHVFSCVWVCDKGRGGGFWHVLFCFFHSSLCSSFCFCDPLYLHCAFKPFFEAGGTSFIPWFYGVYVCVGCVWVWFLREYIQGFCTTPSWAGQRRSTSL